MKNDRCETAENREPLEIEKLVPAYARRGNTPRAECLRAIICLVGEGGLLAFMQAPQPAFGDRTGAQLLQQDPSGLLKHLRTLEKARDFDLDDDLDERIVIDPYECHAPSRRSDKDLAGFLSLIDSLPTGNDRKEATR